MTANDPNKTNMMLSKFKSQSHPRILTVTVSVTYHIIIIIIVCFPARKRAAVNIGVWKPNPKPPDGFVPSRSTPGTDFHCFHCFTCFLFFYRTKISCIFHE